MLNFLSKLFKPKQQQPRLVLPSHTQPQPSAPGRPSPAPMKPPAAQPAKPGPGASPKAKEEWARQAARKINPDATPEQLCGLTSEMSQEEISAQLALLYRRHNRAASSLEPALREEAEIMLDVIAAMRQKHLLK